ncbi:right-handed parallel beta-helix repeat-containing protein [Paenibacillus qinlingensis]|uniref:right-handed parallel beta-helix repeat-containing protein n=1 Tax=Paenibacillus qinlingensis TaxID=1837343 RepID=UPI001564481D|nr:right-handed parallel beta-helix repeat-containing protein [Paenibacillus qinlingensis]NQX60721.1 right-handed parallel beta-helix repeat-containing protein [Paenibacillus qinlingensis]
MVVQSNPKKLVNRMGLFLLLFIVCCAIAFVKSAHAAATTYYVSQLTGQDRSDYGSSTSQLFQTIQYAANLTNPGDTVYVMNGTYNETTDQSVFQVTRSGSSAVNGMISYLAYPGHSPKLKVTDAWNHIVVNASYIRIEGFEIAGDNSNLSRSDGEARYDHYVQNKSTGTINWSYLRKTNTNGILIKPANETAANPHHITIRNNQVHDVPGAGIGTMEADYITVENNIVYNNSWYTLYATSGISLFHSVDTDTNTSSYKNIIRNNRTYNNKTLVKWGDRQFYSDGNGIIIDDNQNSQLNGKYPAYNGKTLVTNNVSYNNGGSGIHAYHSSHVDLINNTAYNNSSQLDYGEIYAIYGNDINILNNIMVARTGMKLNQDYLNTNVNVNYNIYHNGNPVVNGVNDMWGDPLFMNAATGDFRVKMGSKAVDTGTTSLSPTTDINLDPRPRGASPDRGAYESQNVIGNPSFEWGSLGGGWNKELNSAGIKVQSMGAYSGSYKTSFATTAATKLSQTVIAPVSQTYTVTAYINTNIASNVKLGVDVAGVNQGQSAVATGGYKKATFTFNAVSGQAIKVWISAPQTASGWVAVDDVSVE